MKGWRALLFSGVVLAGLGPRLAHADQTPIGDRYDTRMRLVAYNSGQVVHLSTIVGATMVVSFGSNETVTAVAETDTIHLAAVPKGNYLFLKPSAPLALQPVIVLTQLPDGQLRRYVFEIETVSDPSTANGADGVYYAVQFTYPAQEAAAAAAKAAAEAAQVAKLNAQAEAEAQTQATNDIMDSERNNPYVGPRNYRYVAQGDHSLAPVSVWDNGYSTVLTFPGNTAIPSIFIINPDGKEATATYSVHGNTVEIDQTTREVRLRYGGTVLNIYNLGYNTVGNNPGTGTVSPDVTRTLSSAAGTVP
ncbi:TrbG/VirB9 family P-type conjugative transfer protein [Acidocella sp.]|uniref:TrbG/VirB9 family P-type conjugative transfer protein n=1 Tax=Acidocella sp. TaxID=50710 RepID=UPI002605BD82|nr:TrbG/VirB9 family P-type conjugative transfer protein [Acidocella sp.]MDD2794624.1 TrbG/VirB9 family P-type conjugative transfer protein [Acidocella sp.]